MHTNSMLWYNEVRAGAGVGVRVCVSATHPHSTVTRWATSGRRCHPRRGRTALATGAPFGACSATSPGGRGRERASSFIATEATAHCTFFRPVAQSGKFVNCKELFDSSLDRNPL
jgi:hypothetical protein